MNKNTIEMIVIGLIFLPVIYLLFKGKDKTKSIIKKVGLAIIKPIIQGFMEEMEVKYIQSGLGKLKLEGVIDKYYGYLDKLPRISKFILKAFFKKEDIINLIESLVPKINQMIKNALELDKNALIETLKSFKNSLFDKAINMDFNGDKNLISNEQLIDLSQKMNLNDDNGYVQAFAKIKSDLKKKHQLEAGVEAGYKF